ncbi:hypothetical protein [Tenacibaculum sp. 190524A05c]|uniref:hypothetical protein n=1 Tax=Tenacibaculum platacis TaxID=3137852 RepID=UPI0031FB83B0
MKLFNKLIIIYSFCSVFSIFPQDTIKEVKPSGFIFKGFSLGKSSDNSFTRAQPAIVNITYPEDRNLKNSFSVDAFLAYDLSLNKNWAVSFQLEKHKNTLITNEQDNFQFGFSAKKLWQIGSKPKSILLDTGAKLSYPCVYLNSEFNLRHSRNNVKNTKGLQFIGSLSLELPNPNVNLWIFEFLRPFQYYPSDIRGNKGTKNFYASDLIQIYHTHSIGIENIAYEDLTMLNTSFGIQLFPLSGLLYKEFKRYGIIELGYNYTNRTDISSSSSSLYVGSLKTFTAKLNIWFDDKKKRAISIGYLHSKGGNPLKGLENSEFGQIALTAIIKQ